MNPLQLLQVVLTNTFPRATVALVAPLHAAGFWSLEVRLDDYFLLVEWREVDGFLLTADPEHGYGEGADEVYSDLATALPRVLQLVGQRLETTPPYPVRIKELRQKLGLSQEEVAARMGINQASVSKLEGRNDSHVATLHHYVKALGGKLVLKAVFGDREEELLLPCNG